MLFQAHQGHVESTISTAEVPLSHSPQQACDEAKKQRTSLSDLTTKLVGKNANLA